MAEGSADRAVAWALEMRRVHDSLREAVEVARASREPAGREAAVDRDLLLRCWGLCLALQGHHTKEDTLLFPALRGQHPELAPVLDNLSRDHEMIARLLESFTAAMDGGARPEERDRHLDGIHAIMESHFGYEERQLLPVLEGLTLAGPPGQQRPL